MAVSIAAVQQNVIPPRVQVTVTGLTVGDNVEIYRAVAGRETLLRAGAANGVIDTSLVRVDAELPFGTPVRYLAFVNGSERYYTSEVSYALTSRFVVSDAVSGLSAQVIVADEDPRSFAGRASLFSVGDRNILVWGGTGQHQSALQLYTRTAEDRAALEAVLRGATNGIFQLRQYGGLDDVDAYYGILPPWDRARVVKRADEPARLWTIKVAEVDPWPAALEARGFTLADIAAVYEAPGPNLITNSFFETNATGWAGVGGSAARSTAQAHEASASLLLTPTGSAGTSQAQADLLPVAAGVNVHAETWVRCSASRNINIALQWLTGGGSTVSTASQTVAVVANTWTFLQVDAIAPATTGQVRFIPAQLTGTPPAGHTTYIDEAKLWVAFRTLDDLSDDYATLLALAQGDFS